MNGGYFQSVAEVPLEQGHIQQVLIHTHDAQKLSNTRNSFSPSSFLVLFHVPGDHFSWNSIHDEQGAEFTEPFLQVIGYMNVDL